LLWLLLLLVALNGDAAAATCPPPRRIGEAANPGPDCGFDISQADPFDLGDPDDLDEPPPPLTDDHSDGEPECDRQTLTDTDEELSDVEMFWYTDAWRAAEDSARLPPPRTKEQAAARQGTDLRPAPDARGMPAQSFSGAIPGFVFTTRDGVTGYFPEWPRAADRPRLCLEELVPPPVSDVATPFGRSPAERRRNAEGVRIRPKRRCCPPLDEVADAFQCPGHSERAVSDWQSRGLFAVDSSNANSWETAKSHILAVSAADVVLAQEVRMVGDAGVSAVKTSGRALGWNCCASPAVPNAAGPASGGCAVAARRGTGITEHADGEDFPFVFRHRFHMAHVSTILRGGIHIGSIYLKDAVGLDEGNMDVLQAVAGLLKVLVGPWIVGGDWNVPPAALLASGWLALVGGVLVAQEDPTCGANNYDYFVVAKGLLPSIAGIQRLDDCGLHPHWPVRLLVRGDARRHRTRQLVRPPSVPGILPHGPLPEAAEPSIMRPTVDATEIDVAAQAWMEAARGEWASLECCAPDLRPPRFRRCPAPGPIAQAVAGATARSSLWRNLSRRVLEIAAIIDRSGPGNLPLVRRHLFKCWQAVWTINLLDSEREEHVQWLQAAFSLVASGDTVELRRLTAIAVRAAVKLESRRKSRALTDWKLQMQAPGDGSAGAGRPSRRAYQWIRGSSGWQRSPCGSVADNEAVERADAAETFDDECPAHLIEDPLQQARVWRKPGGPDDVPLCDQADVEREADSWSTLWDEGKEYDLSIDPHGCRNLLPLRLWALKQSALSFPVGTGKGSDNVAPRAFARLSDSLLRALCVILMAAELAGAWPSLVDFVLIVLIPKSDGGRRPIGLFPALVRIWARSRAFAARAWEAQSFRPYIFGGSGMGAQRAAWLSSFRAEAASLAGGSFAHSLLDLVKAFERVPHAPLAAAARHGYCLWLLRMSLAAYRLPRTVGVDGCYSRLITATCGITAGSCFATTELRVLLLDVVDSTYKLYMTIDITLYVDDLTLACAGPEETVVAMVALATDHVVEQLEGVLDLTVSVKKSVTAACRTSLARRVALVCRTKKVRSTAATKLLGTPAGGGRRRYIAPSMTRVRNFKTKIKKIRRLRKAGICARTLVATAGNPSMLYGVETTGVSDSHLSSMRSAVAAALTSSAAGRSPDLVLATADAAGSRVDPAFEAHAAPIRYWAYAWWEGWQPRRLLMDAFNDAVGRVNRARRSPWDVVAGPTAAVVVTIWRLGWSILSPTRFCNAAGAVVDVCLDSPAAVVSMVYADVRRWQLARVAEDLRFLVPSVDDFTGRLPPEETPCEMAPLCYLPTKNFTAFAPLHGCRSPL